MRMRTAVSSADDIGSYRYPGPHHLASSRGDLLLIETSILSQSRSRLTTFTVAIWYAKPALVSVFKCRSRSKLIPYPTSFGQATRAT
jgi:hypothetical protein